VSDDLLARAERWLKHDPDPSTRAELAQILERATPTKGSAQEQAAAMRELGDRFTGPLEFGTAGLRGLIGAGESFMNRAVILRTTAGLARYLLEKGDDANKRGVVIGYDGRRMSREFAEDTACALAAAGVPSHLSPIPCPTPVTAFAVTYLGAAAGVMVTASHNPPAYNGYKVYWGNGAQIIPPHDAGIAAAIAASPEADAVPRMPIEEARAKGLVKSFSDDVERSYLDALQKLSVRKDGDRSIKIVYTPLHGVGNRLVRAALAEAGFSSVSTVPEQAEPDGAFPTVAFPNPEEKGALDLAFALARREGAELVVANDPDVDRLAAAVLDNRGAYVQLTGNQIGVLLGHYLLTEGEGGDRIALASLVSSPMLGVIAKTLGVRYEETLTGFKWIANRAMDLERSTGARFVFGFEEALGYTVGPLVRDKDGIGAALLFCELAAVKRAAGMSLLDELEALARRYGLFVSGQRNVTLPGALGLSKIAEIMSRLRASLPSRVGPLEVVAVSDLLARTRTVKGEAPAPLDLPASNVLSFDLEGGSRIIARPSGTEPKIKFYFDVREPMAEGEAVAAARTRAEARMTELSSAFAALAGID
jgi:phosphomannomutase